MRIFMQSGVHPKDSRPSREYKGQNLYEFVSSFVVLDFETTGLDPSNDEIIEVGAIKVIGGVGDSEFSALVKPSCPVSDFITNLTGITNEMVVDSPSIEEVLPELLDFIGDLPVLGHNIHFDVNFLYDNCIRHLGSPFTNDMFDTLRIARNVFADKCGSRLSHLAHYFNLEQDEAHRALADCYCTLDVYNCMQKHLEQNDIYLYRRARTGGRYISAKNITTDVTEFDECHPFFRKTCVFTGTLERMDRESAMQIVVDVGGMCSNSITKKTNYLILGNKDYRTKGDKSNKQKKAEQYQLSGADIEIVSENVFYDMLSDW